LDTSKYRIHTVAAAEGSSNGGTYLDQLDRETVQLLEQFSRWLVGRGYASANSRASAKSGVAKALAQPTAKLSANQRSYWRKWEAFLDSLEEADQDE